MTVVGSMQAAAVNRVLRAVQLQGNCAHMAASYRELRSYAKALNLPTYGNTVDSLRKKLLKRDLPIPHNFSVPELMAMLKYSCERPPPLKKIKTEPGLSDVEKESLPIQYDDAVDERQQDALGDQDAKSDSSEA